MRNAKRWLLPLALALLLGGCAVAPGGPRFAQVAPTLPPVPADAARFFFYRLLEPYETLAWTPVYLNGQEVGVSQPGTVLSRDVAAPGTYTIAVRSEGVYPNQFKTVAVRPGDVVYARIESLRNWYEGGAEREWHYDTFVVEIVDPPTAAREMAGLRFIAGGPAAAVALAPE